MNESKLSNPLICSGDNFIDDMQCIYSEFKDCFLDKESRPTYKGKFIFFNMDREYSYLKDGERINLTLSKPERFLHIVSLSHNDKYTSDPCYNDNSIMLCKNECSIRKALYEFKILRRTECYYRLLRIHRISEVINLANNKNEDIQEWIEEERVNKRCSDGRVRVIKTRKYFIRYNHKRDDYIVILKEDKRRGEIYKFDFITAFPLFSREKKQEFNNKYSSYCMKHKKG